MTHLKIVVDRDLCEVNGTCALVAPDVFEIGDDDVLHVRTEELSASDIAPVEDAVRRCPKGALALQKRD